MLLCSTGYRPHSREISPDGPNLEGVVLSVSLWSKGGATAPALAQLAHTGCSSFSIHRLVLATTAPAKHTEPSSVLGYTDVILNRLCPVLFIHSSY